MTGRLLTSPDGVAAVLHDLGGSGPPLLLTHGNGLNAGMWAAVVPHLQAHFHCHGLDFRGHGASRPADGFSIERTDFDAEVLAAVEALGGRPMAAAGHSLGGATLLRAEMARPGTFSKLWVFEPVLIPDTFERGDGASMIVEISRKRRVVFDSVDAVYERFISKPPYRDCEPVAVRGYVELGTFPLAEGGLRLSCLGETEARIYEGGTPMDFAVLGAVACPVVVSRGGAINDANALPPAVAPDIAAALGNGRLETLDGLTHFGPMENGAVIAASILAHLA
jgi:pimeloyl-ACP methyl ester carboxylesterase